MSSERRTRGPAGAPASGLLHRGSQPAAAPGRSRRVARLAWPLALGLLWAVVATEPAPAAVLPPRFAYGTLVDYPLVFPVGGDAYHYDDGEYLGFWSCRFGCTEDHHAVDILAPKMTEVYAVADGRVAWVGSQCCSMGLIHDNGWRSWYVHLNNDTPGTDDGLGGGIVPGLVVGSRVRAGQLIGWVGDSGLAEPHNPHLHFELRDPGNTPMDPYNALREGEAARGFACQGRPATRVDTNGDRRVVGTSFGDTIVGTPGNDHLDGAGGADLLCGGAGDDILRGGPGRDKLDGGRGSDSLYGDDGTDRLLGGPGNDHLFWGPGEDVMDGGNGRDTAVYLEAPAAVQVDLAAGTAVGDDADALFSIEAVVGTAFADLLRGDALANTLRGGAGGDRLEGNAGDDLLAGGPGDDHLTGGGGVDVAVGGPGTDTCSAEDVQGCEP